VVSTFTQWSLTAFQWVGDHPDALAWAFGLSLLLFVSSVVLIPLLIARMRRDYFVAPDPDEHTWLGRHPAARAAARIIKNVLGAVLLLAGIAMMVLPGQGIITVLVALSLLEFPGKRALELRLIRQPQVSSVINWIRARSGRQPLIIPGPVQDE
jgi:hypothetical protein